MGFILESFLRDIFIKCSNLVEGRNNLNAFDCLTIIIKHDIMMVVLIRSFLLGLVVPEGSLYVGQIG